MRDLPADSIQLQSAGPNATGRAGAAALASSPGDSPPRLRMIGIQKRFGATVALGGVDLSVAPGEVHALVGENGAGKSTLMKVLSGAERPDAGTMLIDGVPYAPADPLAARHAGIAMIYQELNLATHLTVEQNIMLGLERHVAGILRNGPLRQRVRAALARLERPDIRPESVVARLMPAQRQLVEIARALVTDAKIIVMDEPTSSLDVRDIEHLVRVIESLRSAGVSIIYISHFLEEVRRVATRFTVLRDGQTVGGGSLSEHSLESIVSLMIGRKLEQMFPHVPHATGDIVLRIDAVAGMGLPVEASLDLHRGEILGVAGLVGAGRTELLRTVFGLAAQRGGSVAWVSGGRIRNVSRPGPATPFRRWGEGIGLVSEDRRNEGLAASRSVGENMLLSRLAPLGRWGIVWPSRMKSACDRWITMLSIKTRGPDARVRELSGGNQQKVALARLLHHGVDVLLLDEPTRGIDVASKSQIYRLVGELAAAGKSVLMVSSYTPELLGVCDRIAVMHRGRLGKARPTSEWTEHAVVAEATSGGGAD